LGIFEEAAQADLQKHEEMYRGNPACTSSLQEQLGICFSTRGKYKDAFAILKSIREGKIRKRRVAQRASAAACKDG